MKFNAKFKIIKERGVNEDKISFTDWLKIKENENLVITNSCNKNVKKSNSMSNSINISSNNKTNNHFNKNGLFDKQNEFNKTFIKSPTPDLKTKQ